MDRKAFQDLQAEMPWTDLWSADFLGDPRSYSRYEHCLINMAAQLGKALQRVERADHYGLDNPQALKADDDGEVLSIIIMSALKAANVHPDGPLDLSRYIEADLIRRAKPHA